MIELKVEPYCHNCSYFKPKASTVVAYYNGIEDSTTTVTCKSRIKCGIIYKRILDDMQEKKSEQ